jgi:hypothetical protein
MSLQDEARDWYKRRHKCFEDLNYEAYRCGRSELNEDRFDQYIAMGYDPEEITLNMMSPRRPRPEEF